ncbi:hypothetical protein FIBSPDRAFT_95303 [Athelia psychrophila]|uniref:Uncharacterized protein n=1 Tax=Athelia psychrophila TaxID=1759441 RepID=A0A166TQL8_9AGAM|nr:hypothetical protein FIBSPDRAFT_95303 [Fibularhizoctonia sp. CBS 109695]
MNSTRPVPGPSGRATNDPEYTNKGSRNISSSRSGSVHILADPTSCFPPEILALIFTTGLAIKRPCRRRFEITVSQVCRKWRYIALGMQHLWTDIHHYNLPTGILTSSDRMAAYMARSGETPVSLRIRGLVQWYLEAACAPLVIACIHRCYQLSIDGYWDKSMSSLLTKLLSRPTPLLTSIDVAAWGPMEPLSIPGALLSFTAPSLTSARIGVPGGTYITAEGTTPPPLPRNVPMYHDLHRAILMNSCSLTHLELELSRPLRVPLIALPALKYLLLDIRPFAGGVTQALEPFQAPNLHSIALIYNGGRRTLTLPSFEPQFPLLQSLTIIGSIESDSVVPISLYACLFPHVVELTWRDHYPSDHIPNILEQLNEGLAGGGWHGLQTISLSMCGLVHALDVLRIRDALLKLKEKRPSITKIKLAQHLITAAEGLEELREIVVVEPYLNDWPVPFLS